MQHDDMTSDQQAAHREFRDAHNALLAALNGYGRPVASEAEVAILRVAIAKARGKCEAAGVEVETLWEYAQRKKREDEDWLRESAAKIADMPAALTRRTRVRIAAVLSAVCAAVIASTWMSPWGVVSALVAAFITLAAALGLLAQLFPTPAFQLGRVAMQRHVYLEGLFPKNSDDEKDFQEGVLRQRWEMVRRGDIAHIRAN